MIAAKWVAVMMAAINSGSLPMRRDTTYAVDDVGKAAKTTGTIKAYPLSPK